MSDFPWEPPIESTRRVGDYVETMRIDRNTLTVSYSGPPIPHELQEQLAKFWRERLDRIFADVLCGVPVREQSKPSDTESPEMLPSGIKAC